MGVFALSEPGPHNFRREREWKTERNVGMDLKRVDVGFVTMSNKTYIDEVIERASKATPGKWEDIYPNVDDGDIRVQVYHANKRNVVHDSDSVAWKLKETDARFIAHARTDVVILAERLKRVIKYLREHVIEDLNSPNLARELESAPKERE